MSDCKTVTYDGKVYQIGGLYEFSDEGKEWAVDELLLVGERESYPFEARQFEWELIREANYTMGTITPAPPEPTMAELFVSDFRECAHLSKCVDIMIDKGWKK